MHVPYISDALIHWTGRGKTDDEAFETVKIILNTNRFLLKNCPTTAKLDAIQAKEQIVCFTDIPLELSRTHCFRFGNCGIAVKKSDFIEYGANPVLYYTRQMATRIQDVYSNILKNRGDMATDKFSLSLDELLGSLSRLFQAYSYEDDDTELNYYQREWRLVFDPKKFSVDQKPGTYTLKGKNEGSYFIFEEKNILFIVVPRSIENEATNFINNNHPAIDVKIFEDIVIK